MSRRERSALQALPLHAICVVVGLAIVVPVLFGVLGGFKDNGQLATRPFGLPSPWVPENYLEIIGSLERELKIQIPDESLAGIQTVKDLLNAVEARQTVS